MDGILGIGRGAGTEGIAIMDVLSSDNLIGAKLYGIHLSRNTDGLLDGELDLGEVNTERFSGEMNYMDCVPNDTGFWEIPLEDAGIASQETVGLTGRTAIMDTGTSYILMPEDDALALHKGVEGYKQDGETFFVPCDTKDVLQFHFNTKAYNISTTDWVGGKVDSGLCRSNVVGRQTFSETQWLVGDVFLKNVYSVFDFDKSRVGLGVKRDGEEEASAESAGVSGTGMFISSPTMTATTMVPDNTPTASSSPSTASSTASPSAPGGDTSATSAAESQNQDQQSNAPSTSSASLSGPALFLIWASFLTCI
jgi:hypothetical protein